MDGHEFIWNSLTRTSVMAGIAIVWSLGLTAIVISLAVIADKFNERIKKLENFLKDDMEQEEIMNGNS